MAPRRRAESTPSRNRESEQEPPKEYGIFKLIDELGPYLSYAYTKYYGGENIRGDFLSYLLTKTNKIIGYLKFLKLQYTTTTILPPRFPSKIL